MQWDAQKIKDSNKLKARTDLKNAIRQACKAGYFHEDICSILADTLNEIREEKKNG